MSKPGVRIIVCCALLAGCAMPISCRAADCTVDWALSTRGIGLGAARDRLQAPADGGITVSSVFTPSSFLSMFGVDPGTREMVFDAGGQASQRTETREASRPERNVWRRSGDTQWQRSLNGTADKQAELPAGRVIDSTSFPYLLYLGLLPATPGEQTVNVVSKGKIYPATLSLANHGGGDAAYLLGFRSADGKASVDIDADYRPVRFEFTDEHGTLRGQRSAWSCR